MGRHPGEPQHYLRSSMANYFDYPFGDWSFLPGLAIDLPRKRFRFRLDESKPIPIRVVFRENIEAARAEWDLNKTPRRSPDRPEPTRALFIEPETSLAVWSISGTRGERYYAKQRRLEGYRTYVEPQNRDRARLDRRKQYGVKITTVSAGQPLSRTLFLDDFLEITEPGEYELKIHYGSSGWADPQMEEWVGSMTSEKFRVTIVK